MRIWRYGLMGVALAAQAQIGVQIGPIFYSVDREVALGKQLARELALQTTPLDNEAASISLYAVAFRLAQKIPGPKYPYAVTLVKDDLGAEPIVLPGGQIFVSAAQFSAAQSESELAGMVAHAMGHAANRDVARLAVGSELGGAGIPLYLALILNGAPEFDATLSGAPAQVGSLLRAAHLAADAVAVKTMAASGYNPAGLARYVERTAKDDGLPEWQAFEAKRLAELRKGAQ